MKKKYIEICVFLVLVNGSAFAVVDADLSYEVGIEAFKSSDFSKAVNFFEKSLKAGLRGKKMTDCFCKLYSSTIMLSDVEKSNYYENKCYYSNYMLNPLKKQNMNLNILLFDNAQILSRKLHKEANRILKKHYNLTNIPIFVVTVPSTNKMNIEEYSQNILHFLLDSFSIKNSDKYAFFLIALNDRKYNFLIGDELKYFTTIHKIKKFEYQTLKSYSEKNDFYKVLEQGILFLAIETKNEHSQNVENKSNKYSGNVKGKLIISDNVKKNLSENDLNSLISMKQAILDFSNHSPSKELLSKFVYFPNAEIPTENDFVFYLDLYNAQTPIISINVLEFKYENKNLAKIKYEININGEINIMNYNLTKIDGAFYIHVESEHR